MPTILAELTRGGKVESVHHGVVVVADTSGEVIAAAGNPDHFAYFRSSAKPFQAVPLVESGAADAFGFTQAELALCCASHNAEPWHQQQVSAMLGKIGLSENALQCGVALPEDEQEAARVTLGLVPRSPLQNYCSGKHVGMLATCVHLGYPIDTYLDPDHPLQRRIRTIMAEVLRFDERAIYLAPDGCSLPTFGASMRAFAIAFAAFASPESVAVGCGREHTEALNRLRGAMVAYPENVTGKGELDTDLMSASGGRVVAKLGAEGLLCLGLMELGVGIAIRILDGAERSLDVVTAATLEQLGLAESSVLASVQARHPPVVRNHNGWQVGEIRSSFRLARTGSQLSAAH